MKTSLRAALICLALPCVALSSCSKEDPGTPPTTTGSTGTSTTSSTTSSTTTFGTTGTTTSGTTGSTAGTSPQNSFSIGTTVFSGDVSTNCQVNSNGYYVINGTTASNQTATVYLGGGFPATDMNYSIAAINENLSSGKARIVIALSQNLSYTSTSGQVNASLIGGKVKVVFSGVQMRQIAATGTGTAKGTLICP